MRSLLFVPVFALSLACNRTPAASQSAQAAEKPAQAAPAAPAGQSPAEPPARPAAKPVPETLPDIVARVNGENVARAEFERAIRNIEARAGRSVPADQRDEVYRGVLDELIAFKLVLAEARARNIGVSTEEVASRIAEIRKQFQTEDAFKKALASRQMTPADLESETRTEILVNRTIEAEVLPKVSVSPQDLEAFYRENPEQFKEPEQVRASHILFPVDRAATPEAKKETRAQAEAVLKRAKAGEDFAALAKEFSKDSSAAAGGDLNYFPRGQMVPPFEQAAFGLEVGALSDVVETDFGLHIIKVTDRKQERVVPLNEVTDQLTNFLKQRKQQAAANAFLQALRAKYKVEVLL